MKNEATLKFKNFTARPRFFWVRLQFARAGVALCCARSAEAVCLERSSADAKPSGVGKNFKNLNFRSRNATDANYVRLNIDRDIIFNAYRDINSSADRGMRHGINSNADRDINSGRGRAVNFKISNANLRADLAHQKAGFR
ncbi:hypothetical protein [uncultured Campylobacter sp.]|uniref:hypothetical protein n=1 Tax=uncultured Campylobacter sp. TaxID=218934 RepID=UPI0028E2DF83|nr:hypothetical protein [uncultured Campylobacter sp.]